MEPLDISNPISHSSLYPMLLASLMMQNYTPETTSSFNCEYDYIIVGAGSAGSVVANRLSEDPSSSVLLLEAGPSPPPITDVPSIVTSLFGSYLDWNINTVPQKYLNNRQIAITRGKAVGGSSLLNTLFNVRGNPKIFDQWAKEGCPEWSYEQVLPYFKKLEDFRVPEHFDAYFHGLDGPVTIEKLFTDFPLKRNIQQAALEMGLRFRDVNSHIQYGIFEPTTTLRDGRRCSSAKAYLVPAGQRSNLHIVANAHVHKVIIEHFRATGVEFWFNGEMHVVSAKKEVIVSAGALLTPQVLMLSGIGPREHLENYKIPVVADLPVGKNLQDHPYMFLEYDVTFKNPSLNTLITEECNIRQYINEGTGPLRSMFGVVGIFFNAGQIPDSSTIMPDNEIFLHGTHLFKENRILCSPSTVITSSRGSVTLNSSSPYDLPLVDVNFYADPEDLRKTLEGAKFCNKIMATKALRIYQPTLNLDEAGEACKQYKGNEDDFFTCIVHSTASTTYHVSGTAKMGDPRDSTTVVDPQLRVKGVNCLRVVDASVMPVLVNSNTNIPVYMIAEKASDLIKASTDCF